MSLAKKQSKKNTKKVKESRAKQPIKSRVNDKKKSKGWDVAIKAALVSAIITSIVSIAVNYHTNKTTEKIALTQLDVTNRPILDITKIDRIEEAFFYNDFKFSHDEYIWLESEDYSNYIMPLNIVVNNIGNGTLFDLQIKPLNVSNILNSVEKNHLAKKFLQDNNYVINETVINNLAPINIIKGDSRILKTLYLFKKDIESKGIKSVFHGLCLYKDVQSSVKTAILEISLFNIPESNDNDVLDYALYLEDSSGYNRIVWGTTKLDEKIELIKKDYLDRIVNE